MKIHEAAGTNFNFSVKSAQIDVKPISIMIHLKSFGRLTGCFLTEILNVLLPELSSCMGDLKIIF